MLQRSFLQKHGAWLTFGGFAVLVTILVLAMQRQGIPKPVFPDQSRDQPEQMMVFTVEEPAVVAFTSQSDRLRGAWFQVFFPDKKNPIRLSAKRAESGEGIGEALVLAGTEALIEFDALVAKGGRIEVHFEVTVPKKWTPKLKRLRSGENATLPLKEFEFAATIGGKPVEGFPGMVLLYRSGFQWMLWLWPLVLIGVPVVIWKRRLIGPWLVLLGICCVVTSWHGWVQRYGSHIGSMDPDRYGSTANYIVEWLIDGKNRDHWQANLRNYDHMHVFLVPLTLAAAVLAGMEMHDAYVLLNALVSFAALLLFYRLLNRQLNLSVGISVVGVLMFACHLVFLRAFARPTTDQLGMLLVVWMIGLLVDRMKARTAVQTVQIAILAILLAFVRPPGLVYALFLLGMTVFCDWIRERKIDWRDNLLTIAKTAVPVILVVAAIYLTFDLAHNFGLAMEKNKDFIGQFTLHGFWVMSVVVAQVFFVGWAFLRFDEERWKVILVLGLWIVMHTLLLIVAKAALIPRLGVPILPCVLALCCMGLDRFRNRKFIAWASYALLMLIAAGNVCLMVWAIEQPSVPKTPWLPYIYR